MSTTTDQKTSVDNKTQDSEKTTSPQQPLVSVSIQDLIVLCQYVEKSLNQSNMESNYLYTKLLPAYGNVINFVQQWVQSQQIADEKKKLETVPEEEEKKV